MGQSTIAEPQPLRGSRAETKAATRDKLLAAAKHIFLTTGYQGATLDTIAARAGFTKGAVYWHFPNKQALFLALVAESISGNLAELEGMLAEHRGDPERLRATLAGWIDGIDGRETLPIFGVELEIEARRDPSFRALHQNLIGKHEAALAGFLTHYFDAVGETPVMPADAARLDPDHLVQGLCADPPEPARHAGDLGQGGALPARPADRGLKPQAARRRSIVHHGSCLPDLSTFRRNSRAPMLSNRTTHKACQASAATCGHSSGSWAARANIANGEEKGHRGGDPRFVAVGLSTTAAQGRTASPGHGDRHRQGLHLAHRRRLRADAEEQGADQQIGHGEIDHAERDEGGQPTAGGGQRAGPAG